MLGTTEGPSLWSGLWIQVLQELILPLVASLANQAANAGAREGHIVHELLQMQGICAQWPSGSGPGSSLNSYPMRFGQGQGCLFTEH